MKVYRKETKTWTGGFLEVSRKLTHKIYCARGGYCKDTSSHFLQVQYRGVLMRSILTIMLETKNQLEKCYY